MQSTEAAPQYAYDTPIEQEQSSIKHNAGKHVDTRVSLPPLHLRI